MPPESPVKRAVGLGIMDGVIEEVGGDSGIVSVTLAIYPEAHHASKQAMERYKKAFVLDLERWWRGERKSEVHPGLEPGGFQGNG